MKVKELKRHNPFSTCGKEFFYAGWFSGERGRARPGPLTLRPCPGPVALTALIERKRRRHGV
jgi:hypothetical protein